MSSSTISLDIMDAYRRNANSKYATFDLYPRKGAGSETPAEAEVVHPQNDPLSEPLANAIATHASSLVAIAETPFNPEVSVKTDPTRQWDQNASLLVSSKKWLQMFGLKRSRLDLESLIRQIAFRHSDDFDHALKMPVCSRYGTNLFQKYFRRDGQSYNIIVPPESMKQIETRLIQAISLFKRRLYWLTSESRRIFGVIEEKSICIVLDFKDLTDQQFHFYLSAVERVLLEQVSKLSRFNLILAADDPVLLHEKPVCVTSESIDRAVDWLWKLDNKRPVPKPVPKSATVEALIKALSMPQIESVILFTEGSSTDGCREMIRERITNSKIPVHLVSYNCTSSDTIGFLKNLASTTNARFHAYAVVMEMETFERVDVGNSLGESNLVLKKKAYGGVPRGAGVREDVILLFEELEEAKNSLAQLQAVLKDHLERSKTTQGQAIDASKTKQDENDIQNNETYMGSAQWLSLYGLLAKRLGFYEALSSVAFRHQDGVIDLKVPPINRGNITEANTVRKLINAKYCDRFAHVLWKDGELMHVQVTPEFFRIYKDRLGVALDAIQRRIEWLHHGSREIFGTVIENRIYLLIDTSVSMQSHIEFVREKTFLLMQEQLRHKQMVNIIAFNSQVYLWQKSLTEVTEQSLQHGWNWVKALTCQGTTNVLAALQHALGDRETQAVYLLTDGRPDQPPKSIIAQSKMPRSIPIHTISFNCNDRDANEFLYDLAKETGGRFHYYSQDGCDIDFDGPEPWQSEDIAILRREIELGWNTLDKIEQLKNECELLSKCKESSTSPKNTRKSYLSDHYIYDNSHNSASGLSLRNSKDRRPLSASVPNRISSANISPFVMRPKSSVKMSNNVFRSSPPVAAHTKTSLLRTVSSGGHFASSEWLFPETKEIIERQEKRKARILKAEVRKLTQHDNKTMKLAKTQQKSSKKWLAKNGLAAKKLTIIDALAPTFIPHEPKYVPILNKEIFAKVFDEVLPIAYVSEAKRRLHLVNPLAVDFDRYSTKVEEAIQLFKKRLDQFVWKGLSENQKRDFASDNPISFIDNEVALTQALSENGWPVSEKDIRLLVKEIRQGQSYIEQAMALKAAAAEKSDKGLPEHKTENDAAEQIKPERNEVHKENEDIQSSKVQRKSSISSKRTENLKASTTSVTEKNLKVIARNSRDGFYYPGVINDSIDIRRSEVLFSGTNSTEIVPKRFIIPLSGAICRPPLAVGDFVLCRVINSENDQESYVPGRVIGKPIQAEDHGKFYPVCLYTGRQEQFLRISLIKVSHSCFQFTVRYVKEVAREKKRHKKKVNVKHRSTNYKDHDTTAFESSEDDADTDNDGEPDSGDEEVKNNNREESDKDEQEKEQRQVDDADRNSKKSNGLKKTKSLQKILQQYVKHQTRLKKKLNTTIKKYCIAKNNGCSTEQLERQLEEIDEMQDKLSQMILRNDNRTDVTTRPKIGNFSSILEMRQALDKLKVREEILARFSDDGWYYKGSIKGHCGDDCYFVQDSMEYVEKIWREDILADYDNSGQKIHKNDYVIAPHPDFTLSYCPGKVRSISKDRATVRFYDNQEESVSLEDVYLIPAYKYDYDVKSITALEERWIGQVVVARNDKSGLFFLGKVKERTGNGRQYSIEWSDGSTDIQSSTYIFGPFSKKQKLTDGDYVLAMTVEHNQILYKPGVVKNGNVEFYDSPKSESTPLEPDAAFGLSEDMYDRLVSFIRTKEDNDYSDAESVNSSSSSQNLSEDG